MKTAERVFGFASCALGLLPLISDTAKAQQNGVLGCQAVATLTATGTTTLAVLLNAGVGVGQRVLVCGYSIAETGPSTQSAMLVMGLGSACTVISGFTTQTPITAQLFGPTAAGASAYLQRNGVAYLSPPNASICVNSTITTVSIELNYSLQ